MFIHLWPRFTMEVVTSVYLCAYLFLWVGNIWKKSICCSTCKYALKDSVEYICHARFYFIWEIIMIIIWWYHYLFIISHFLQRFPFPIIYNEVPLVFFVVKIGNLLIIHHKSLIFHVTFWTLIIIVITVDYICNLYCFIIIMCISIKIPFVFTFSQNPSNQCWSSATSCVASVFT